MAKPTIVTRAGKGSALTWTEGDSNFTNLRDATITLKGGTGGTDVASDLNGTITIVAGSGISVSGDNSAKTVTITNTSSSAYPQITDDTTTNASRYVLFDNVTSGDASTVGVSSTKLYFNPSTGVLTATSFSGSLTGNASSATYASAVTLTADNTTNATNYPLFSSSATGNESPRTDTGFTYNPSTGVLTATSFSGSLTGTATKATNLVGGNGTTLLGSIPYQSGTDTTSLLNPNTTTTQKFLTQVGDGTNGMAPMWNTISSLDNVTIGSITPQAGSFTTLTVRSANELRFNNSANTYYAAFKAGTMASNVTWTLPSTDGSNGTFLQTDGAGNLVFAAASGGSSPTITDDTTTNATRYILFDDVTSGSASSIGVSSTKLTFNPSSGLLTATGFSGTLTGNASSATYASAVTLTADNTGNATNYPLFVANATGNESPRTDTGFTYNPATGTLIATYFTGQASKASNLTGGNGTTLLGSLPYQSGTDTTSMLNPNTTTTLKYLTQVGDGTNGMAPMWSTIASLNNVIIGSTGAAAGTFTDLTSTGKLTFKQPIETIYDLGTTGGTIAPNAANGSVQKITLNSALTINAFTSPVAGQSLTLIIYGGTSYTSITSTMKFAGGVKTLTATAGCIDILSVYYDGTTYFASLGKGYA